MTSNHEMRDEYARKIRYDRLLADSARDKNRNLDLNIHRFKAVGRNRLIGFFSTLNMAFREVDSAVGKLSAGPWTEVKIPTCSSYVEDLVAKRIYARMGQKAPRDDCGINYGRSPSPGLGEAVEMPMVWESDESIE